MAWWGVNFIKMKNFKKQNSFILWAWEGSNFIEMKNFKKQKSFILCLAPPVLWVGPKSEFCILSDPPNKVLKNDNPLCTDGKSGAATVQCDIDIDVIKPVDKD